MIITAKICCYSYGLVKYRYIYIDIYLYKLCLELLRYAADPMGWLSIDIYTFYLCLVLLRYAAASIVWLMYRYIYILPMFSTAKICCSSYGLLNV